MGGARARLVSRAMGISLHVRARASSVKSRIGPMLGFKKLGIAVVTIASVEHPRHINKEFNLGRLRRKDRSVAAVRSAVLVP